MTAFVVPPSDDDTDEQKASLACLSSTRAHIEELLEERELGGMVLLFSRPNQACSLSRLHVEGGVFVRDGEDGFAIDDAPIRSEEERQAYLKRIDQTLMMLQVFFKMQRDHLVTMMEAAAAVRSARNAIEPEPLVSEQPGSMQ
jgi:hypothetical protein